MVTRYTKQLLRPLIDAALPLIAPITGRALWSAGIRNLKRSGFLPRTVFDIGVAEGTPNLYAAFPHAHFILVDPTRESRPHMERLERQLDAEIHALALGDRDGTLEIETRLDDIQGATFFREIGAIGPTARYPVPMRRFDSLFAGFARPALCKIDVQGAEMMVLEGLGARIQDIDAIIVETSTIPTLDCAPALFDILAFAKRHGFVVFDVLGMAHRPLDKALAQIDLLLVHEDSPLRADRRWRSS